MHFRAATTADLPAFLTLHERFFAEEGYPYHRERIVAAAERLIATPAFGRLVLIEAEGAVVGYLVVTFGYSLEFHGRDAFVDELYVDEPYRGRGAGRKALGMAEEICSAEGIAALHLEVEHENEKARELYRRAGYVAHTRHLMTKRLQ